MTKEEARAYDRMYYKAHKEKKAAYYKANKEVIATRKKVHYEANKGEMLLIQKKYRKDHKEEIRAKDTARCSNRKAKEKGIEGCIDWHDIHTLIEVNLSCYYCDIDITNGCEVDHMTPFDRGGKNDIKNLCVTCRPCNRAKGVMIYDEFIHYSIAWANRVVKKYDNKETT